MQTGLSENQLRDQMEENFQKGLKYYRSYNFQKGIEYFQKALGTCEILNDSKKRIEIMFFLAHAYQLRNIGQDFQISEEYFQEILELGDELDPSIYYKIQLSRGNVYVRRGEYDKGIEIFTELHGKEFKQDNVTAWLGEAYAYFNLGKFEDSTYFMQSRNLYQRIIDEADPEEHRNILFYAHHNIGHILHEQMEYIKGMLAFQESLQFCNNETEKYDTYIDMALVFIDLSQYDLGWAYIDKAQKFFESQKNVIYIAGCLFAKGKFYRQKGRIQEACRYFELALSGYREKEYFYGVVKTYHELEDLFSRVDPDKAELYHDQYIFYFNYVNPMVEMDYPYYKVNEEINW